MVGPLSKVTKMANRVTSAEVKEVIDTTLSIDSFISIANDFVTTHLVGQGLTTTQLKNIELYIAAHFVAIRAERGSPRYEQIGDSRVSWEFKGGEGLAMTRFGQTAILLDSSQTLAKLSGKNTAEFRVF